MNNLIIKQVSATACHKYGTGTIWIYDFCKSKRWGSSDDWLTNKRGNGWSHKENRGYYTKFKLELIK